MICKDYYSKKKKKESVAYIDSDQEFCFPMYPMGSPVMNGLYDVYVHSDYKVMSLKSKRMHVDNMFQNLLFEDVSSKKVMENLFRKSLETQNAESQRVPIYSKYLKEVFSSKKFQEVYGNWSDLSLRGGDAYQIYGSKQLKKDEANVQDSEQLALLFDNIYEKIKIGYGKYKKMKNLLDERAYDLKFAKVQHLVSIMMSFRRFFDSLKFVFSDESSEAKFTKSTTSFSIEFFYDSGDRVFVSAFKDGNLWAHEYEEKDFSKIREFINAF